MKQRAISDLSTFFLYTLYIASLSSHIKYLFFYVNLCSKTPIEILHTIFLGPVKYLLSRTIIAFSQQMKDKLHARIQALDMSAFPAKVRGNITRNYGSYVGWDYKLWMQVAVFVLKDIVPYEQLLVWEFLSKVKYIMQINICTEIKIA